MYRWSRLIWTPRSSSAFWSSGWGLSDNGTAIVVKRRHKVSQEGATTAVAVDQRAGLDPYDVPAGTQAKSSWTGRFRLGLGGAGPRA
jgi:hypothetical protein